ncbi:aldolase [Paenibacillus sp. NPDC058071]|uniref:aldolase n=1 Tax=Paenibacillus sp. NPDC058071 TaxID=3346326 RepID=UPI0036DC85A7
MTNRLLGATKRYSAYGLRIESEIELPELPPAPALGNEPEIIIEYADLHSCISEFDTEGRYSFYGDDFVLIVLKGLAAYRMTAGRTIEIMPEPGIDDRDLRLYLLGICFAVLLFQRRIVPIHGSSVLIDGKAYVVMGDSGAGKSTLTAALLQAGCQMLSDDITPLSMVAGTHVPTAHSSFPRQKLWTQSLDYFGMDSGNYARIMAEYDKYDVPAEKGFHGGTAPLGGLFELGKAEIGAVSARALQPLERIHFFQYHTYSNSFVVSLGLQQWHFAFAAKTANAVPFYQLRRPAGRYSIPELTEQIFNLIKQGELV